MDQPRPTADRPSFVYVTYIRTNPERLWQMLTDPAFTEQWWQTTFETDWAVGSLMTWHTQGFTIADPDQVVLEYDPPRRLAYTWNTMTPELAHHFGFTDQFIDELVAEPRSRVAFDIQDLGDDLGDDDLGHRVKLTVVHDGFLPGGRAVELVSDGWPQLLSSVKSLLETGQLLFS